jgi:hypothetical protein
LEDVLLRQRRIILVAAGLGPLPPVPSIVVIFEFVPIRRALTTSFGQTPLPPSGGEITLLALATTSLTRRIVRFVDRAKITSNFATTTLSVGARKISH